LLIKRARTVAQQYGGKITETSDRVEAMESADVLYAGSWAATQDYGNRLADQKARGNHANWCVDETWFKLANKSCRFMHCLPVRRGVEVEDDILDGPRSLVVKQARNRMWAQMAILHKLLAD